MTTLSDQLAKHRLEDALADRLNTADSMADLEAILASFVDDLVDDADAETIATVAVALESEQMTARHRAADSTAQQGIGSP